MVSTVLVVEDNINIQKNIKILLEFNSYKVFTANNGKEALKIFKKTMVENRSATRPLVRCCSAK